MNQKLYLPVETLEHIIWLIQDYDDTEERQTSKQMFTFLTCALVCKIWTRLARRRLLSLYFPEGKVKITSEPNDILELVDIFQSPLCTLDRTFIRVLCCNSSANSPGEMDVYHEPFFISLSSLDASIFPSLQKLELTRLLFSNESGRGDFASPSFSVLSQIKSLHICPLKYRPLTDLIDTIRLFPFVEEITLWFSGMGSIDSSFYQRFPPPKTLRKLSLDRLSLYETKKWLTLCQPAHTTLSSLTFRDILWDDEYHDIEMFLDEVVPNLEELVLDMYDWEEDDPFVVENPERQFTKNLRLRRLTILGPPDVVVKIAHYLLKQAQFAPELEVLNITFRSCYPEEAQCVELKLLDEYTCTRPSLRQIVLSSTEMVNWEEVKSYARKNMPCCEEKGILELRPCSRE